MDNPSRQGDPPLNLDRNEPSWRRTAKGQGD